MKDRHERYKSLRDIPSTEPVAPGAPLCAGCGGLATLRLFLKALGTDVVAVDAAGCLTLLATWPHSALECSWLYTTMAGASAAAQGIRDGLDILARKGRLAAEDDLKVLAVAGDGSSHEMGLAATSAAIHRGLEFWYLCYDNEAYGNTGFQSSAATPASSVTSTSSAAVARATGERPEKKDLFEIWRAHEPPWIATVCAHEATDLAEKVHRAGQLEGPKLFHALAVCPTGWGFDPELAEEVARLAVATGVWPLKEARDGVVRHTVVPARREPVEEYLRPQARFRHLFEPERREEALARIQRRVDEYWEAVQRDEGDGARRASTGAQRAAGPAASAHRERSER